MVVSAAVKARVEQKLREGIALAEAQYKQKFAMPTISYKLRGRTAGIADYIKWEIRFNSVLLMENVDDFIARTIPHELAHLITDRVYPEAHRPAGYGYVRGRVRRAKREVHGRRWQAVMRVLGVKDITRCHSYDVANAQVKRKKSFTYECPRCKKEFSLGPVRHKRAQDGSRFWHPGCGSFAFPLRYKGATAPAIPLKKPVQVPATPSVPTADTHSKKERAVVLYKANKDKLFREDMIALFMRELDMTRAGASTYYYNCQKGC